MFGKGENNCQQKSFYAETNGALMCKSSSKIEFINRNGHISIEKGKPPAG
jgi:hypothetical protein